MDHNPLRIALPAGRYEGHSRRLLAGVVGADSAQSRRLTWSTRVLERPAFVSLVKVQDMPEMLDRGDLDLGVTSDDWLSERGVELIRIGELDWIRFEIQLIADAAAPAADLVAVRRVATPYPRLAAAVLADLGLEASIIHMSGSCEGSVPWLADAILDCVETGRTLEANRLRPIRFVRECRLWWVASPANAAAMREVAECLRSASAQPAPLG